MWLRQDVVDKLFQLTAWVPGKWESKLKNDQHDRPPEWYWTIHRIHPMSFYKRGNTMEKLRLTDSTRIDMWHVLLDCEDYEYRSRSDFSTCRHFSRGVIFTRARVSLALLSLRKNGGLLVVYVSARKRVITVHHNKINRLNKRSEAGAHCLSTVTNWLDSWPQKVPSTTVRWID